MTDMANTYTAIIKHDGQFWVGWVEEVPGVNCQATTRDELLDTLRVTLAEAIELNRADARSAAHAGFTEEQLTV